MSNIHQNCLKENLSSCCLIVLEYFGQQFSLTYISLTNIGFKVNWTELGTDQPHLFIKNFLIHLFKKEFIDQDTVQLNNFLLTSTLLVNNSLLTGTLSNVRRCWLAIPLGAGVLCWVLACHTIEKKT